MIKNDALLESKFTNIKSIVGIGDVVAIRYNANMKIFYDRLKENGKHTTVAQVAVIKIIVRMMKNFMQNSVVE